MQNENNDFKNSDSLTKWVRWFLYIQIVVAVISIISSNMEYRLLTDYENGIYLSQTKADGDANDQRQQYVHMAYLVVFIVSGIFILKWIYRANYNARQLGAKEMKFSPGWSVGWYFIPVFWLWKPYQAMKEIWQVSQNPTSWKNVPVGVILPLWWFVWLVNNFLGQAVMRMVNDATEIAELKNVNIVYQISDVTSIFLAIVTLSLVMTIYRNQVAHANSYDTVSAGEENSLEEKNIDKENNQSSVRVELNDKDAKDEIDLLIQFLNQNPSQYEIENRIAQLQSNGFEFEDILVLLDDRGEAELAHDLSFKYSDS